MAASDGCDQLDKNLDIQASGLLVLARHRSLQLDGRHFVDDNLELDGFEGEMGYF